MEVCEQVFITVDFEIHVMMMCSCEFCVIDAFGSQCCGLGGGVLPATELT